VHVAQRAKQVGDVVLGRQQPGLAQDPSEGFLHQIFGLLAGAAHRPRGSVEPIDVIPEPLGVELPRG
jgi:hypothetical protein